MAIYAADMISGSMLLSDQYSSQQISTADWLKMVNWSVKSLWRLLCSIDPDAYFSQIDFTLAGGSAALSTYDFTTIQAPCLPSVTYSHVPIAVPIVCDGIQTSFISGAPAKFAGFGNPFLATDVGCTLVVTGALNGNNNGTFTVTALNGDQTVNVTGSHTSESLPTNATATLYRQVGSQFRALHGIDYQPDTTTRRTIPRRTFQERNKGRIGRWYPTVMCLDRAYDIRGYVLNVTPYEIAGGPYRAYYRYAPYLFTSATDAVPLDYQLEGYDEYLATLTARKALGIEESDQGPMAQQLEELKQEIMDEHERDDEAPSMIADVEGETADRGWW